LADKRYYVYADSSIEADALALIHDYTDDVNPLVNPIKSDTIKWKVFLKKDGDIKHLDYDLEEIGAYLSPERIIEFESETIGGACQFDLDRILVIDEGYRDSDYNIATSVIPNTPLFLSGIEIDAHYENETNGASSMEALIYVTTHNDAGHFATVGFTDAFFGDHIILNFYAKGLLAIDTGINRGQRCYHIEDYTIGASTYSPAYALTVEHYDYINSETDVWMDAVFSNNARNQDYLKVYFLYDTELNMACCKDFKSTYS